MIFHCPWLVCWPTYDEFNNPDYQHNITTLLWSHQWPYYCAVKPTIICRPMGFFLSAVLIILIVVISISSIIVLFLVAVIVIVPRILQLLHYNGTYPGNCGPGLIVYTPQNKQFQFASNDADHMHKKTEKNFIRVCLCVLETGDKRHSKVLICPNRVAFWTEWRWITGLNGPQGSWVPKRESHKVQRETVKIKTFIMDPRHKSGPTRLHIVSCTYFQILYNAEKWSVKKQCSFI